MPIQLWTLAFGGTGDGGFGAVCHSHSTGSIATAAAVINDHVEFEGFQVIWYRTKFGNSCKVDPL